jgi:Uma2 family endonuclease
MSALREAERANAATEAVAGDAAAKAPPPERFYLPPPSGDQRVVLHGVNWQTYIGIGELLKEHPVRLTYDRGSLEIMVVSLGHESPRSVLGRLVEALLEEMDIDAKSGGSMTFQREDLDRGVEPDDCYWIACERLMRGKQVYDVYKDPPPDLGLETEITHPLGSRPAIFAALRIPEMWRYDGNIVHVLILGADGQYHESERSLAFPFLPMAEVSRFLNMRTNMSETKLLRQFRAWIREQLAKNWQT